MQMEGTQALPGVPNGRLPDDLMGLPEESDPSGSSGHPSCGFSSGKPSGGLMR